MEQKKEIKDRFNRFKKEEFLSNTEIDPEFKEAFISILSNRFAFWLEYQVREIEQINSSKGKQALLEAFEKQFIEQERLLIPKDTSEIHTTFCQFP